MMRSTISILDKETIILLIYNSWLMRFLQGPKIKKRNLFKKKKKLNFGKLKSQKSEL